jgi:hypothetical protein
MSLKKFEIQFVGNNGEIWKEVSYAADEKSAKNAFAKTNPNVKIVKVKTV